MDQNLYRIGFVALAAGLYVAAAYVPGMHDPLVALAGIVVGSLLRDPSDRHGKN